MSSQNIRSLARRITAGGWGWAKFVKGTNADRAFKEAQEDDRRMSGDDPYSGDIKQAYGYRLYSRTPMTMQEAQEYAYEQTDRMDKGGQAGAVPVAEMRTLGREKEGTVKVKAKNSREALEAAKQKVRDSVTVRQGAKLVIEITKHPEKATTGGLPKVESSSPSIKGYIVVPQQPNQRELWLGGGRAPTIHRNKHKANAAVREMLGNEYYNNPGSHLTIWRVEVAEQLKVVEPPSDLPTWEVGVKYKQVKLGSVIGYMFFGVARS